MDFMIGSDEHPHTEADAWDGDFTFEALPLGAWISYSGRYVAVNYDGEGDFIRQNNCYCPFCTRLRVKSRLLEVISSWKDYEQQINAICDALRSTADQLGAEKTCGKQLRASSQGLDHDLEQYHNSLTLRQRPR